VVSVSQKKKTDRPGNFDRAIGAGNLRYAEPSFPEAVTSVVDAYV
jgi:hypothetical protein